ncbi:cell division protein ZapA [Halopseudomonas bauzanensis]|uniref:cell division protein ZapA n=1 Tax=Halopseudomonas bauzanensis TaxID=653930 RepID=UPI002557ADD7|nr:cell division protein ZapA [Halopseudomonas bauzanensis]
MSNVRVVSFLGQEYSFRISENEELLFQQATELLELKLNESRQQRAGSDAHQLLMTTALALCVSQIQQTEQLQQAEHRLTALVDRLQQPDD